VGHSFHFHSEASGYLRQEVGLHRFHDSATFIDGCNLLFNKHSDYNRDHVLPWILKRREDGYILSLPHGAPSSKPIEPRGNNPSHEQCNGRHLCINLLYDNLKELDVA